MMAAKPPMKLTDARTQSRSTDSAERRYPVQVRATFVRLPRTTQASVSVA